MVTSTMRNINEDHLQFLSKSALAGVILLKLSRNAIGAMEEKQRSTVLNYMEKFRKYLEGTVTKCVYGQIQLLVFIINCFLLPEILNSQL